MKTVRTIFATASCFFLGFCAACLLLLTAEPDFLRRPIYFLLQQSKIICLIIGVCFLLVSLILSFAISKLSSASEDNNSLDDTDEEGIPLILSDEDDELPNMRPTQTDGAPKKKKRVSKSREEEGVNTEDQFSFDDCINVGAAYSQPEPETEGTERAYCIYCGARISKNSSFCSKCGKKIQ